MNNLSTYAERRVLSIMLANPSLWPAGLDASDFEYEWHSKVFEQIPKGEIALMELPDPIKVFALNLDEDWTPENIVPFVDAIKRGALARRFAANVGRLRK